MTIEVLRTCESEGWHKERLREPKSKVISAQ
jgi:hypothetical protein